MVREGVRVGLTSGVVGGGGRRGRVCRRRRSFGEYGERRCERGLRPRKGWADACALAVPMEGNGVANGGVCGEIDELQSRSSMAVAASTGSGAGEEVRGEVKPLWGAEVAFQPSFNRARARGMAGHGAWLPAHGDRDLV